jgi:outer membrane protein TolC
MTLKDTAKPPQASDSPLTGALLFVCFFTVFCADANAQDIVFRSADEAADFAVRNSAVLSFQRRKVIENMKIAKYAVEEYLPSFDISFSETDTTNMLAADTRTRSIQANVTQKLFDGGKRRLEYDLKRISAQFDYNDYESSLRQFRQNITVQYYQYLRQVKTIAIQEELFDLARTQLAILEKEVSLGITLETDYLEYYISFINIENEKEQGKRDLRNIERKFKIALELGEEAVFSIEDDAYRAVEYFYYEPYSAYIWNLVKNSGGEIKKQSLSLQYEKKQLDYSERWYMPTVSLQGGITFSGSGYPLTEPKYSLRLMFDFSNNPLFPLGISGSYGFDKDRLYNVSNSSNVPLSLQPAYFRQRRLAGISMTQSAIQLAASEKELQSSVYDAVIAHDNALRSADTAERTIALLARRLEFSERELANGTKKHIDYLEELLDAARVKISLLEYQTQALTVEQNIEILSRIPFGGLKNVVAGHE